MFVLMYFEYAVWARSVGGPPCGDVVTICGLSSSCAGSVGGSPGR